MSRRDFQLSPADRLRAARDMKLAGTLYNHLAVLVKGFTETEPNCANAVLGAFVRFAAAWGKQMKMSRTDFVEFAGRVFGDLES
jgi:hypothetical protein